MKKWYGSCLAHIEAKTHQRHPFALVWGLSGVRIGQLRPTVVRNESRARPCKSRSALLRFASCEGIHWRQAMLGRCPLSHKSVVVSRRIARCLTLTTLLRHRCHCSRQYSTGPKFASASVQPPPRQPAQTFLASPPYDTPLQAPPPPPASPGEATGRQKRGFRTHTSRSESTNDAYAAGVLESCRAHLV